jgi:nicotinate-nucleotide adenylyltransferase
VLVFGGSFDPPHVGHVTLPEVARAALGLEWTLYVPAGRSPHKASGPVATGAERVEMLAAALAGHQRAGVCTLELERAARGDGGPSYTIDTLRELAGLLPRGCEMRLLIGADQALAFASWREPGEIERLAEPVVMLRGGESDEAALVAAMAAREPGLGADRWKARIVRTPLVEAASSGVRELLARRGEPGVLERLRALVPGAVLGIIEARGLYRAG